MHGILETTSYKDADKFAFLSEILRSMQSLRTGIISSPVSLGASVNHGVFTASFSNRRLWLSLNNVFLCGFYFQSAVVRRFSQRLQFAFVLQHFTQCFWKKCIDFSVRHFNRIQEAMPGLGCVWSSLVIGSTWFILRFREEKGWQI